jgi:hypothetical protein
MIKKKITTVLFKLLFRSMLRIQKFFRVYLYLNYSTDRLVRLHVEQPASELIVSLTSYGKRINKVAFAIASIGLQVRKAERIVLWLDEQEFQDCTLPRDLTRLKDRGLEIRFCHDIRSYKKYMPTRNLYPNARIVTIDDDFLYPSWLLKRLDEENRLYPDAIIGLRAHEITHQSDGTVNEYRDWKFEVTHSCKEKSVFLTTGGGVLFPVGCFKSDVALNENYFTQYCPTADDIWFKCMSVYESIEYRNIPGVLFWQHFYPIDTKGEGALKDLNLNGANDYQITSMEERFGISLASNEE